MKQKTFSNLCRSVSFFSVTLLLLIGIFSANASAQQQNSRITVNKLVCNAVGEQNTCNGRNYSLMAQTVPFLVYLGDSVPINTAPVPGSQIDTVNVKIDLANGSQGAQTNEGFTPGVQYLVCENVPTNFDTLPRPDQSTGGQQTREGDCIRFTAVPGNNVLSFINFLESLSPTSAPALVAGRTLDARGRGLARARVVLTDSNGITQVAITNAFGYYRFEEIPSGQTYIIGAFHKTHTFDPRVINLAQDLTEENLISEQKDFKAIR
jgi:hypothetical protein